MELMSLKAWVYLLKTGQKASCWKFVGTRRHNAQKKDNFVSNETNGYPSLHIIFQEHLKMVLKIF